MNRLPGQKPLTRMSMQPYARPVTAFLLHGDNDDYDLNPPYQRGAVWTREQQQRLIESILRELPIGAVIVNDRTNWRAFDHANAPGYAVVDGKQRILAVRAFESGELSVPAWWFEDEDLEQIRPDGTVSLDGLSPRGRRGFSAKPAFATLEAKVPTIQEEALIFDLINSAGTAQTSETIDAARAVSQG